MEDGITSALRFILTIYEASLKEIFYRLKELRKDLMLKVLERTLNNLEALLPGSPQQFHERRETSFGGFCLCILC